MQEAEAQYLSGLHKDFEYFGLHFNLGNLYRAIGRLNEAVAAYRLAIRFNARWAAPHNHLGEVYLKMGLKDQAEVEFTAAVAVELKNESAD
jgi:tetratricopeptide (TPR) repeat protein